MDNYTVYVIPQRGKDRKLVGQFQADDGTKATLQAMEQLTRAGEFVPETACWWAEPAFDGFGQVT